MTGVIKSELQMRATLILSALLASLFTAPLRAEYPVVVELYTSQGCSSCPPADELLQQLAEQRGVIALALHVDYWDYLGWRDEFARAAFSHRQSQYAHTWRQRTVYTPQIVIHGGDYMAGNRPDKVMREITEAQTRPPLAALEATRQGPRAAVTIRPLAGSVPASVFLVRFTPQQTVDITHGENAGRSITYVNIVRDWNLAAEWDGRTPLTLSLDALGDEHWALIVQADGTGPVLAAMMLD
ncbi:MAG: DUF1223 domain-containing protein [Paracoccaceae bacterium]